MISSDEISQMFDIESEKLHNLINIAASKTDLSIHEIVETYYQIINVSSMIAVLKEQGNSVDSSLLTKIHEVEKTLFGKFNSTIHPKIMEYLRTCISEDTKNLQSGNSGEKSKDETESQAKLFEELRQKMSTKEFVEQYDKGLVND